MAFLQLNGLITVFSTYTDRVMPLAKALWVQDQLSLTGLSLIK